MTSEEKKELAVRVDKFSKLIQRHVTKEVQRVLSEIDIVDTWNEFVEKEEKKKTRDHSPVRTKTPKKVASEPTKVAPKDSHKPKRPRTAFHWFKLSPDPDIKMLILKMKMQYAEQPVDRSEPSYQAKVFESLSEQQRNPFEALARLDKERFNSEMEMYKAGKFTPGEAAKQNKKKT